MNLNFEILLINGIFTLLIGFFVLLRLEAGRFQKHFFYYTWSVGFVFYGIQIILRALDFSIIFTGLLTFISFSSFILGTWLLTRRKTVYYVILVDVLLFSSLVILFIFQVINMDVGWIVGFPILVFTIIFGIIDQRVVFGKNVDKLIIGWSLLIFSNTLLYFHGFLSDSFAIISKVIILFGIIDYDFVIIAKRIQRGFNNSNLPFVGEYKEEGGLKLVIPSIKNGEIWKSKSIVWIINQIHDNLDKRKYTYLFSFFDVLSHRDLIRIKWISPENIRIFRFSNSEKQTKEFTNISPDLLKLGVTINEIARKQKKYLDGAGLFFTDLSATIHTFGVYPVYNLLLQKMGTLRESGITMFAFFLPNTHDEIVVSLFSSIADEIIKL